MGVALQRKKELVEQFRLHPTDTGSPEVQIALLSERIDYHRAHRSSVLADLRGEIEERYDHADSGDQLCDRVDCLQLHDQPLSNWAWSDESGIDL